MAYSKNIHCRSFLSVIVCFCILTWRANWDMNSIKYSNTIFELRPISNIIPQNRISLANSPSCSLSVSFANLRKALKTSSSFLFTISNDLDTLHQYPVQSYPDQQPQETSQQILQCRHFKIILIHIVQLASYTKLQKFFDSFEECHNIYDQINT